MCDMSRKGKIKVFHRLLYRWILILLFALLLFAGNAAAQENLTPAGNGAGSRQADEFGNFDEFAGMNEKPVYDPLIVYNRAMTTFNDKFYFWVLKPVASGYAKILPAVARRSVNRFFLNLGFPVRGVNNLLQLKGRPAAEETFRFAINTTAGIGGLFDPAEKWFALKPHPEDFGQTLGWYGAGGGFPIVFPFLGPSNLRDTIGKVPDWFLYPPYYLEDPYVKAGITSYNVINYTSLHLGEYEAIKRDALDLYIFLRNAYEQNREKKIKE